MPRHPRRPGYRIATASGFPRAVGTAILRHFGWDVPVVCDEDVANHRPAPDPVRKACDLLGVPASEAIVVGDTPQDPRSARAAGALSIGVATGKFSPAELRELGPALVIASLEELPALLERKLAIIARAPGRDIPG
jgi:phosphoglycolate phosphatase